MKKLLLRTALILTLLAGLLAGTCWLYADQLLDSVARPYLEKQAAQQLQAKVQLKQLILTDNGVELDALRIEKADQYGFELPRTTIDFTLSSLWKRQLSAIRISEPHLQVSLKPSDDDKTDSSAKRQGLPLATIEKLPITINLIEIVNGQLLLRHDDREWQLHRLNITGQLQPKSDFHLSALFGPDEYHPIEIQGSVEISPQQTLNLQNISWQNQQLLTTPLALTLSDTAVAISDSQLRLKRFNRDQLQDLLKIAGQTELLPASLDFSLSDIGVSFALDKQAVTLGLEVSEGLISWEQIQSELSEINLKLTQKPGGWDIKGQFQGPTSLKLNFTGFVDDKLQISGNTYLDLPNPGQLKSVLFGGSPLPLQGGLQLTSEYSWRKDGLQTSANLQGYPAAAQSQALLLLEHLNGSGQLQLSGEEQNFSLQLQLTDKPIFTAAGTPANIDFELHLTGLGQTRKLFAQQILPQQLRQFTNLKARGALSQTNKEVLGEIITTVEQISVANLTLNKLSGKHNIKYTPDRVELTGTDSIAEIDIAGNLTAKASLKGSGIYSKNKFSFSLRKFNLTQLNYLSADEQTGIGDAAFSLRGTIKGTSPDSTLALDLSGTVAASEVLVGNFYADLSPYQGRFSVAGQLNPKTTELTAETLHLDLPSVANFSARGQATPQRLNLQLESELSDLATSFGEHIGPLLYDLYPALEELTLEGQIGLAASLNWTPTDWQSSGKLHLQGLDAYWQRLQLEMVAGNGEIPFSIAVSATEKKYSKEPEKRGHLSFGSLGFGLATLQKGKLQLTAAANRFSINSPLLLHLADGEVRIENLNLGLTNGQPHGSVDVDISAVDLQSLTQELDLPVMQGRLTADLGRLRYQDRQLKTDGLVNIEVFGGRFQVRNMRYSDPFSSYPLFHGDIDFTGLDLLQATRTFDFGEMNGVLDGHIHGLQLFGNTPSAFKAAVATRPKGKRNISVKALNNLSILSQGGASSALSRGIYRFIDFYRYRQLGFECALENDTFTLIGTAMPDSERYLVHGGLLPPRIDITTTTPTISFKEMVNRLGRIQRAGN